MRAKEFYAGMAMCGLIASEWGCEAACDHIAAMDGMGQRIAAAAWDIADAMEEEGRRRRRMRLEMRREV